VVALEIAEPVGSSRMIGNYRLEEVEELASCETASYY
jgi:hypothetical protein